MAVKIEDFSGNVLFTVSDADYATAKANQFEDGKIKLGGKAIKNLKNKVNSYKNEH